MQKISRPFFPAFANSADLSTFPHHIGIKLPNITFLFNIFKITIVRPTILVVVNVVIGDRVIVVAVVGVFRCTCCPANRRAEVWGTLGPCQAEGTVRWRPFEADGVVLAPNILSCGCSVPVKAAHCPHPLGKVLQASFGCWKGHLS